MPKKIIIKNDLLDLIINSEYRTQVKIDLEQLIYLVRDKQNITILIKTLETSIDQALVQDYEFVDNKVVKRIS